jgi:ubiquinone/menaquinone biosynthesis C-methylase UbiE
MRSVHRPTNNDRRTTNSPEYTGQREDTTTYFSGKTENYQRHRPGYPAAALKWILKGLPPSPVVADVGCGTGISSRALAAAGASVIGVDPNEEMLDAARAIRQPPTELPIDYRTGTGEATGLESRSLDCLVCAQAFHWFDREGALREFHRVLRPGGRLALRYERVIHRAMDIAEQSGRVVARFRSAPPVTPWFESATVECFDNPAIYTLSDLLGRARSSSYWPESGSVRVELEGELEMLFHRYQVSGVLHIRQYTEVTLATAARL